MTHIRTVDLGFSHEDFAQVHQRLVVPCRREIFINDPRQIERILHILGTSRYAALREASIVVYLERSGDLAAIELHREGDLTSTTFNPDHIVTAANLLTEQAKSDVMRAVFVHNHPSGVALHSPQDLRSMTACRNYLLQNGGIDLAESVVMGAAGIPYEKGLERAQGVLNDVASEHGRKRPRQRPLQRIRAEVRNAMLTLHRNRLEYVRAAPGVLACTRLSVETNECNGI